MKINKLIVCLDLTYMDELLISYLNFVGTHFDELEQVIFHHNIHYDFSDEVSDLIKGLPKPLPEFLKEKIQVKIDDNYQSSIPYEVVITERNNTAEAIIETTSDYDCSTCLLGKKSSFAGSGYLIERVIQKKPKVALWVVPEQSYHQFNQVLIPIDFTSSSAQTIENSLQLNTKLEASLSSMHVFEIPHVFFPYVPQEHLKDEIKKESDQKWEKFHKKYLQNLSSSKLAFEAVFHGQDSIAQTIYMHAIKIKADLIILHLPKGTTHKKIFQLLRMDMQIPLLITA